MSLAEFREYRGLTQEELGARVNLSANSIRGIEKRKQIPKIDTAIRIAKELEISLRTFCNSIGLDVGNLPKDEEN